MTIRALQQSKKVSVYLLIFASILLLTLTKLIQTPIQKGGRHLIAPPQVLVNFSFGFKDVMADSIWVRLIQDLDYCQKAGAAFSSSEILCPWIYESLDLITSLSPKERMFYIVGALNLSIVVSDIRGADLIFDKALKNFPNDWRLLYRASYHAIYETQNKQKAIDLLIRAGKAGAPPFVFTLAGRLASDLGKIEMAQELLAQMKTDKVHESLIKRLEEKIAKMQTEESTSSRKPAKQ